MAKKSADKAKKILIEALIKAENSRENGRADYSGKLKALTDEALKKDDDPRRRQLLRDYKAGAALVPTDGIRKRLAAIDLAYFGRAYLPHYFSRPSPPFHAELDTMWSDGVLKGTDPYRREDALSINGLEGSKRVTAAPRGHAKSTNLTFKDTLHAVLYAYKHYIILLSDTAGQACGFLDAIKDELEDNAAIREDFGALSGDVWRENVLVTTTGIKVHALGAGQKVRGLKHKNWRPDLFVLDDIENDENVRTPEQRRKLENWYTKAVAKAGDTYTDFIYIGTMLHYDSLLAHVLKNPGYKGKKYKAVMSFSSSPLWQQWEGIYNDLDNDARDADALAFFKAHEADMLAGTEVLWPDKLSYYQLMQMRIEDGEAAFNSELQNEPINPDDCLFNEEWFDYFNPFEVDFSQPYFRFVGFVDPSLGKSKKSDFSAIITLAQNTVSGYIYIVDADIERRHPDMIIEDVIGKAKWLQKSFGQKYWRFGVETVQFQWFLKEALAKECARRRIYLPIVETPQTSDKTLRIQTLQPDIKNKYIKFNKQHKRLIEQLKYFPMADHDDGPDALEGARSLLTSKRKRLIIRTREGLGI